MRRLILGTAGHIDHGKTALVHALTGVDTDRLPEEKRRGITIDLGFANLTFGDGIEIGIVDVPGHEAFIRNMLAGATGIDVGLLVVAADEGVMPQTREHHAILALLGVRGLVVALTKSDLAEPEWRDLVTDDVNGLLGPGPFAGCPIVAVSARTGEGLDVLRDALAAAAGRVALRDERDLFRLPIDRVFTVRGTGTVITGTVWSGEIERDAQVRILPADQIVRVRAIQSHGSDRERAAAGQRAALALAGTPRTTLKRGDVLVAGDAWEAGPIVTVRLHVLRDAPPVRPGQRVRFHVGTTEAVGRVVPFRPGPLSPGDEAWVQIRLEQPVVARAGDRFVIRSWSPVTTIAGGQIVEPAAPRRRRPGAETTEPLREILTGSPAAAIASAATLAGWTGASVSGLAVRTPHSPRVVEETIERESDGLTRIGATVWAGHVVEDAGQRIMKAVEEHQERHPLSSGATREELRAALPAPAALADWVIHRMVVGGALDADANHIRTAGFNPRLTASQQMAARTIQEVIEVAGFAAPATAELPTDLASRPDLLDLLHYLVRAGALIALTTDRFASPAAIDKAIRLVRDRFAGREPVGPADFRDVFGVSRKYLIPLLEYLDRVGVTARAGDLRQVLSPPQPLQVEPGTLR